MTESYHKKIILAVHARRTKWAPSWAVVRRFGKGKRTHPSQMTAIRRHWRRSKIKVKPRRSSKKHLG